MSNDTNQKGQSRPKNDNHNNKGGPKQGGGNNRNQNNRKGGKGGGKRRGNGAAIRMSRRNMDDVAKIADQHASASNSDKAAMMMRRKQAQAQGLHKKDILKVIPLGGQDEIGSKNMLILEYNDDAIVVDCGFSLGVDLPGINYAIADMTYLESIKHKVRGYVFTHGHLDHIGATPYVLPKVPAPIYGSRFTIGMIEKQIEGSDTDTGDYKPESIAMNIDNHEKLKIGPFMVELVRVTHSIPDSTGVIIDTPVGKIVHTGDFRLDPEPLDKMPTDLDRLEKAGQDGVLLLVSESTDTDRPGRTATEHSLEQSFHDIFGQSRGRVLVSSFSSNINRAQMIINAAVESGRKVVIDGRSLLSTVELAVKLGYIKIPKGTIIAMRDINTVKNDREIAVICTGSQGEPNAALQRMSTGEHNHLKIKENDTVIFSSSVIPGNERSIVALADNLMRKGASVYRHATHEVDGCGPLHVSGHACRDEYRQMIEMTKPKYIMPNHGHYANRHRYIGLAKEVGMPADSVQLVENGEVLEFDKNGAVKRGIDVPVGSILVDQNGSVVDNLVIKDRLLMSGDGIVVTVLTVDKKTRQLLTSPDIITRGFIHMKENEELMNNLRNELRQFTQRRLNKVDVARFKQELRDDATGFLFNATGRTPIVIPVVNLVGPAGGGGGKGGRKGGQQNRNRQQQDRTSSPRENPSS